MPTCTFHFLNVKDGDCSIIQHSSGHVSVIDVCNARKAQNKVTLSIYEQTSLLKSARELTAASGARKNYNQKSHPENPIEYLHKCGITDIFRFALTHPDMDHMDGIKDLFEEFKPVNFYDTDNDKEMNGAWNGPYREEDWLFYKNFRDSKPDTGPRRLALFSGDDGIHRGKDWNGKPPGDAFYTLAPTPEMVIEANKNQEYHEASYVFLYWSPGGKILLSGDSHDKTWEHILDAHAELVTGVDLLIAPHHGRDSGRSYDFLDIVNPRMTLFGNAPAEHLAYDALRNRDLYYITNNMAGNVIVDCTAPHLSVYVSNEAFARDENPDTFYEATYDGWFLRHIRK